jgi:hypothetical protein
VQPQAPGQIRGQGDEHRTVSPARARARDLPPQHRDLVPQHEDLGIFGGVTVRQVLAPQNQFAGSKWSGLGIEGGPWGLAENTESAFVYQPR